MQTYVALLRAINVGGNSVIKMADLKTLFEGLGFDNVRTHIQSGNIIFDSSVTDRAQLVASIETALQSHMNYPPMAFIFTASELQAAAAASPFKFDDQTVCQLLFLAVAPESAKVKNLMDLQGDDYQFALHDRVLYYAYSRSLAGNRRTINFEKVLGVSGTARNLNVVNKLIELAS